ncbi:adenine phosphoribosyltransferase isoform X2 [Protopterus annectens]|uniref:adenine phosphoribosyltransferase isoform X2 n=1 Tax=Protopterus annectens TaxID=7888 RepID=UPI001CF947C3|nr:adenine phosphoribosyltransferase isoform X2 [Protopterus annectens]
MDGGRQRPQKDVCPILKDPKALGYTIDLFEEHLKEKFSKIDHIVGLDARGFLFGPLLSQRLGIGFILVRKKGKLPGPTVSCSYALEYGTAEVEMQADAVEPGQKVVIIDDLIATGGTLNAACRLLRQQNAEVLECTVVLELKELNGSENMKPVPVHSLISLN